MKKFLKWIATSPLATAVKVGIGAGLSWLISNIGEFKLSPAVTALIIAVVTVVINALNPQDNRYGVTDGLSS
jgi:uncharacterized membrane protein YgaE (UPF0421/DUF939 family)